MLRFFYNHGNSYKSKEQLDFSRTKHHFLILRLYLFRRQIEFSKDNSLGSCSERKDGKSCFDGPERKTQYYGVFLF